MSKISELSDGGSLVSSDYLIAVRSGGNVKVRMDQINVDQVDLGDNEFIRLGNSQDLTMVHTSTQSIINQAGIGDLLIQKAGATKLTINASGIDVTGTVTADGLTVSNASGGNVAAFTNTSSADLSINLTSGVSLITPSTGILAFGTSSTERMRIDASGNVGIGTSSPSQKLDVKVATDAKLLVQEGNTAGNVKMQAVNNAVSLNTNLEIAALNTQFFNGGTERMRIDASGNVGIGTSSPSGKLDVSVASNQRIRFDDFGSKSRISSRNDAAAILPLLIDASDLILNSGSGGNVGIGGTPTDKLTLLDSGNLALRVKSTGAANEAQVWTHNDAGAINGMFMYGSTHSTYGAIAAGEGAFYSNTNVNIMSDSPSGVIKFSTGASGGSERMRLDASGNLLVGVTSVQSFSGVNAAQNFVTPTNGSWAAGFRNSTATTPWGLAVEYSGAAPNNTSSNFLYLSDSATLRCSVMSNGGVQNYQANDANLSDRREKTNFSPAKSYLDAICAIPVQTFNYIDQNMEDDPSVTLGVVAQDVQTVAPELVMESNWGTEEDPKMRLSIYQTDLQYALMKCIQEQQATIEALTARIAALES
jgi:hypothetical protein